MNYSHLLGLLLIFHIKIYPKSQRHFLLCLYKWQHSWCALLSWRHQLFSFIKHFRSWTRTPRLIKGLSLHLASGLKQASSRNQKHRSVLLQILPLPPSATHPCPDSLLGTQRETLSSKMLLPRCAVDLLRCWNGVLSLHWRSRVLLLVQAPGAGKQSREGGMLEREKCRCQNTRVKPKLILHEILQIPFWWEKFYKGKSVFLIPELWCEGVPRNLLQSCGSVPGGRSQRMHHEYGSGMAGAISNCLSNCSFPIPCILFFYQQTAVSSSDTHDPVTITFLKCLSKRSSKQHFFLLSLLTGVVLQ